MPRRLLLAVFLLVLFTGAAVAQQTPTPEAAAWWAQTTALASDSMQGRDTGTAAYQRAAQYVADQFRSAGLQPAGDGNTYFQTVPMKEVDLDPAHSSVELLPTGEKAPHATPLRLLEEITVSPRPDLPTHAEGLLVFIGYGLPDAAMDLHGKVAVYFNNTPQGVNRETFLAQRSETLAHSGAIATLSIDNPAATEPSHWPVAYARTVTLASAPSTPPTPAPVALRIEERAAARLFEKSSTTPTTLFETAEKGEPLHSVDLAQALRLHLTTTGKNITSPNILAILPGSDPTLNPRFVALSAHLDGYGFGTPVLGDPLYNGALDDAAYVALLIELAKQQAALPLAQRPRRSLLFCIFTGEEKGLLGSAYFTAHPTVPIASIAADLNLDQLRPIFPLRILTMEGLTDSTLGQTAQAVAARYGIELRKDREPERNLFRRADNYNFVRAGVPIASFIFGYNPGTPEERTYRDWYARRYHKPQDDLATPIDWNAAVTFNRFFASLAVAVADLPTRPAWSAASPYAPSLPH